jgi:protein-tyrosine phosphatase
VVRVLFVCYGNICRSPTAAGVFRKLLEERGMSERIEIDSAGTHAHNIGCPPDPCAREAARRRGIDIGCRRGRQATAEDIRRFDYILAMDRNNYENLLHICPEGDERKIRLFLEFAPNRTEREVPDPYGGDARDFDRVLDMIEEAAVGLIEDIRRHR